MIDLLESKKTKMKLKYRLPNTPIPEFTSLFNELDMENNLKKISSIDMIISTGLIPFKNTFFAKQKSKVQTIESFYSLLIKTFFNAELKSTKISSIPVNVYVLEDLMFDESELINIVYNQLPEIIL